MKKDIQYSFIAIALLLALGGCKTIRGGGWIDSKNQEAKATFGVNITCKDSEYYGQFTYHDHGYKLKMANGKMRNVSLKALVDHSEVGYGYSCGDYFPEEYTQYNFSYQALPDKSGGEGCGIMKLWDADRSGLPDDNDFLCIEIITGPYAGYYNCGELGGGNLTIF